MKSRTVIFVHGMYMTPICWEQWISHFEAAGYRCLAPSWPGRDKPVEALRKAHPDPQLAGLTLRAVLDHIERLVRTLDERPVLIGHSMGGLIVQLLLQRGIAAAAVAIDSAPPMGVLTISWPFLRSNWPHINPFASRSQPVQMSFERFQYTFTNSMPFAEQRAAYERYVVPESRRVPAESLTPVARIDFRRQRPPLLLIAGSNDHLIPPGLNRTNYRRYRRSPAITDFREFAGRNHFIIGQPQWQEVANHIITWLNQKGM